MGLTSIDCQAGRRTRTVTMPMMGVSSAAQAQVSSMAQPLPLVMSWGVASTSLTEPSSSPRMASHLEQRSQTSLLVYSHSYPFSPPPSLLSSCLYKPLRPLYYLFVNSLSLPSYPLPSLCLPLPLPCVTHPTSLLSAIPAVIQASQVLYPTVGLQTPGEVVEANFGEAPFVYDFEGLLAVSCVNMPCTHMSESS